MEKRNTDIAALLEKFGALPSNFSIIDIAGQGATGVVFRAREHITDREVAIKIQAEKADGSTTERFFWEAKFLASMDHPHIVKIYSSGTTNNGYRFHVMEWLDGINLQEKLQQESTGLDYPNFLDWFSQILQALQYSHSKNIIHRDIKPSNIFLVSSPVPLAKLIDFGIAKDAAETAQSNLTKTNTTLGTPAYMSPEQCVGGAISPASDIYSLACVIFESLTTQHPFDSSSDMEMMYAKLHTEAKSINASQYGKRLQKIIKQSLEKDAALRPTASEMLTQFAAIKQESSGKLRAEPKTNNRVIVLATMAMFIVFSALALEVSNKINHNKELHLAKSIAVSKMNPLTDTSKNIDRIRKKLAEQKIARDNDTLQLELIELFEKRIRWLNALKPPNYINEQLKDCDEEIAISKRLNGKFNRPYKLSSALCKKAMLLCWRKDFADALNLLNQALSETSKTDNAGSRADIERWRATVLLELDDYKQSEAALDQVLEACRQLKKRQLQSGREDASWTSHLNDFARDLPSFTNADNPKRNLQVIKELTIAFEILPAEEKRKNSIISSVLGKALEERLFPKTEEAKELIWRANQLLARTQRIES